MRSGRSRFVAFSFVGLFGVAIGFVLSSRFDYPEGVGAAPVVTTQYSPAGGGASAAPASTAPGTPAAPSAAATAPAGTFSFAKLAKEVSPAVVHIDVRVERRSMNPFQPSQIGEGMGTGFLISPDGLIVTNDHVVGKASSITVRLPDEREYRGNVIGTDAKTDIALIKIDDAKPLPYVKLGDSDVLDIGEWVVAIGNPFGLDNTVTAGIVSAKGRRDVSPGGMRSPYHDFIQTDASINPGNSGGPLLNVKGEVVGINSAVSAQGQGIGFAIPINMAKQLVPMLKQYHRVPRSWLGVTIGNVTAEMARQLKLTDTSGAVIAQLVRNSPAHKFGLQPGSVILSFDGKPVRRSDDLPWLVSVTGVGRTVPVVVAGPDGKKREVMVKLEEIPAGVQ